MTFETWKHYVESHIACLNELIALIPYRGDKECQSQKLVLKNAINMTEAALNGITKADFYGWTETQKEIITKLYERGAAFTASCCISVWHHGKGFIFDIRNEARHGLMRKISKANAEVRAKREKETP